MKKQTKKSRNLLWVEIMVGAVGLFLSVFLHELFHVLMHLDQIPHIGLFPSHSGAIVEILVWLPQGYDLEGEEIAAYTITLTVILATIMAIFKIHDSGDKRNASQILFPDDKDMQKLSPKELLDLAEQADPAQVALTPNSYKKPKRRKTR